MKKSRKQAVQSETTTNPQPPEVEGTPGQLTKIKWEVDTVLLPRHLKLDHIEAVRRLKGKSAGDAFFPGSSSAVLELTEGVSKEEGEDYFRQNRKLVIGTGGGLFGNPTREARVESKTEKMTKLLGLKETPALRKMTRSIKATLEDEGGPTELPSVIRALPRAVNRHSIPQIIMYVQDAIQEGHINHLSKRDETKGLQAYYDEWKATEAKTKGYEDAKVFGTLDKLIAESIARRTKCDRELSFVVQCIAASGSKKKTAKAQEKADADKRQVIFWLLTAIYLNEVVYWQGVELCKAADRHRVLMTDRINGKFEEVERNAVFICADNPILPRASHNPEVPRIDILVIKSPRTENVAIYLNQNLPKCHNIIPLWRMIQSLELLVMEWGGRDIPWNDLAAFRPHSELEGIWSAMMKQRKIDNGYNKEDYKPSEIELEDILYAIQHAFHYLGGIAKWQREHGITVTRKERPIRGEDRSGKTRPAPEANSVADAQTSVPAPSTPIEPEKVPEVGTNDLEEALNSATP